MIVAPIVRVHKNRLILADSVGGGGAALASREIRDARDSLPPAER